MCAVVDDGYAALDEDGQVEVLRQVALEAAPRFGLDVDRLELVLHGFNTTFRVDTRAGATVALRVNTNSLAGPEHLLAQQAWVHAIATETDVHVPDPVPTTDGEVFATVRSEAVDRDFRVVVNAWLEGADVGECDAEQARALGRVMATLHRQAAGWAPPGGSAFPLFDEPLCGDENRLEGSARLDPAGRAVLDEAFRRTREAFDLGLAGAAPLAVHGDLHGGNLKWSQGRLAVFDFDDAGLAAPALDLAVATFYLRRDGEEGGEAALREGYESVGTLPALDPGAFEALVASRQLLLANSLLTSTTPEFREMVPEYLDRTVHRLRHWLQTGRFVLDPAS